METDSIKDLDVPKAKNCVLYMWATAPKLQEALDVMKAWGFEYKTHAMWDKEKIGMGYWFRGQHELLLVGTFGSPSVPDSSESDLSSVRLYAGRLQRLRLYPLTKTRLCVLDVVRYHGRLPSDIPRFKSGRTHFGVNTTMTQYEALNGKTVEVTDTKVKTYKKDGDLRVDRVYLKVEDDEIPKGKISINPTVSDTERATKIVNGREYDTETEKERDPTILEMDGQFPKIGQITDAVNEYGTIELTGLVRCVRDSDEDDWNMFIRTSELDKFSASVPGEDTAEKVEEEKDTAEEFVEDQTNIDTDDEDSEEEEDGEEEILFGED